MPWRSRLQDKCRTGALAGGRSCRGSRNALDVDLLGGPDRRPQHDHVPATRERLLDLVWGMTYPGGTRTVDVHVAQLRRKLGDPDGIRTVRGAGYKLVPV